MKTIFKPFVLALLLLCLFVGAFAQTNQAANPLASGINWSQYPMPVGGNATVTFKLGNNGSDPLPAEKVQWTLNIPINLVTVGTPTFAPPDGTASTGLYELSRTISGTTLVIVLRSHTDIPATTIDAPQDEYLAVYPVTGLSTGGPLNATMNAARVSGQLSFVGNLNAGDDNASASVMVVASLPVQLTSFTAAVISCQANLNWSVAQETGFRYYIVEYSADAIRFNAVKTVSASGSNSSYSATHQPAAGKAYYRLKMVDVDGRFAYSKTITVNVNCDNSSVRVYPNPATDVVNVSIGDISSAAGKKTAVLTDAMGRIQLTQVLNTGTNKLAVNKLIPGMYTLTIKDNQGTDIHKIVISR